MSDKHTPEYIEDVCRGCGAEYHDGGPNDDYCRRCRKPRRPLLRQNAALLAALEAISRGLTNGQEARGETFQTIARAAIAKAKKGA